MLPSLPLSMYSLAPMLYGALRFCVPTWTMRSYRRAASTILRPSHGEWLTGFSTYTSLPAWHPQMVANACQ